MGVYDASGNRITKAALPTAAIPDPPVRITQDLYETVQSGHGDQDPRPEGSVRRLLARSGAVMTQAQIDALYPPATVDGPLVPASGPIAGGTVVTINGTNLDGVSRVTFDGTDGTNVTVLSRTSLQVTTPAHTAGVKTVVLFDDADNVTLPSAFTYA